MAYTLSHFIQTLIDERTRGAIVGNANDFMSYVKTRYYQLYHEYNEIWEEDLDAPLKPSGEDDEDREQTEGLYNYLPNIAYYDIETIKRYLPSCSDSIDKIASLYPEKAVYIIESICIKKDMAMQDDFTFSKEELLHVFSFLEHDIDEEITNIYECYTEEATDLVENYYMLESFRMFMGYWNDMKYFHVFAPAIDAVVEANHCESPYRNIIVGLLHTLHFIISNKSKGDTLRWNYIVKKLADNKGVETGCIRANLLLAILKCIAEVENTYDDTVEKDYLESFGINDKSVSVAFDAALNFISGIENEDSSYNVKLIELLFAICDGNANVLFECAVNEKTFFADRPIEEQMSGYYERCKYNLFNTIAYGFAFNDDVFQKIGNTFGSCHVLDVISKSEYDPFAEGLKPFSDLGEKDTALLFCYFLVSHRSLSALNGVLYNYSSHLQKIYDACCRNNSFCTKASLDEYVAAWLELLLYVVANSEYQDNLKEYLSLANEIDGTLELADELKNSGWSSYYNETEDLVSFHVIISSICQSRPFFKYYVNDVIKIGRLVSEQSPYVFLYKIANGLYSLLKEDLDWLTITEITSTIEDEKMDRVQSQFLLSLLQCFYLVEKGHGIENLIAKYTADERLDKLMSPLWEVSIALHKCKVLLPDDYDYIIGSSSLYDQRTNLSYLWKCLLAIDELSSDKTLGTRVEEANHVQDQIGVAEERRSSNRELENKNTWDAICEKDLVQIRTVPPDEVVGILEDKVKSSGNIKKFVNSLAQQKYIADDDVTKQSFAFRLTGCCKPENLLERIEWDRNSSYKRWKDILYIVTVLMKNKKTGLCKYDQMMKFIDCGCPEYTGTDKSAPKFVKNPSAYSQKATEWIKEKIGQLFDIIK